MQSGGIPPATRLGGGATKPEMKGEGDVGGNRTYAAVLKQESAPAVEGQSSHSEATAVQRRPAVFQRMDLTFIPPQLVDGKPLVEMPYSVMAAGEERWRHTLIGYVLGLSPSFSDLEGFVRSRWSEQGKVRVHLMGKGLFVFQFESEAAKMEVLERGPWSFSRRPLILKPWIVGMTLEKPDVDCLPIWVQFPHLPIDLWTPEALSRISSQMGKPLFADRNTSEQRRLGYARVCIEVKVDSVLFEEIPVRYANGYVHYQKVHYEWVPSKCSRCRLFGHSEHTCKAVQTQVYVPKGDKGKAVLVENVIVSKRGIGEEVIKGAGTEELVVGQGLHNGTKDKGKLVVIEKELPTTSGVAGQVDGVQKPMLKGSTGLKPMLNDSDGWRGSRTAGQGIGKSHSIISLTPVNRGNRFSVLSPDAVINRSSGLLSGGLVESVDGKLIVDGSAGVIDRVVGLKSGDITVSPGSGSNCRGSSVSKEAGSVADVFSVLSEVVRRMGSLNTPSGTPVLSRPDTPMHAEEQNCTDTLLLEPVTEEDEEVSEEDLVQDTGSKMLEADLLKKVSFAIAQLAVDSVGRNGSGGKRRKRVRRGRVAVPLPKIS